MKTAPHLLIYLLTVVQLQATTLESRESAITRDTIYRLQQAYHWFQEEYEYYPDLPVAQTLDVLQGTPIEGHNRKKIEFWDPRPSRTEWIFWTLPGDLNNNGELIDGWGRTLQFSDSIDGLMIWSTGESGDEDLPIATRRMRSALLIPSEAEQGAAANP